MTHIVATGWIVAIGWIVAMRQIVGKTGWRPVLAGLALLHQGTMTDFVGAVLLAAYIFKHAPLGEPAVASGTLWSGLAIVALVYLASHAVRSFRLYVILLDFERSFRRILALYAALTFVNRMFPLKLGEIFRFSEFTHTLYKQISVYTSRAWEEWRTEAG